MLDTCSVADDYSKTFSTLRRKMVGENGQRYTVFVRELKPKYWIVYRDIALGYFLLAASLGLTVAAPFWGIPSIIASMVGACFIGYWIAYLTLFIHEAAHYNLAPTKEQSDRLCDLLISWLIGTTVGAYRPVHFQHHRDLGTTSDSEFTYFFPLSLPFLLKAAFGIRAVEVLLNRRAVQAEKSTTAPPIKGALRSLTIGAVVHGSIVAGSLYLGWWWAPLAWIMAMGIGFPFFAALRQLLEHRNEAALPEIDYREQDHGAYTRLFGDDFFSATFGGAGFNRHLLHHWEPQVSYTNLPELERFLTGTEVGSIMDSRRTNYIETFRRLLSRY